MNMAIDLDNIMVHQDGSSKLAQQKFTKEKLYPKYTQSLCMFGEIGIVLNKKGHRSKLTNTGTKTKWSIQSSAGGNGLCSDPWS